MRVYRKKRPAADPTKIAEFTSAADDLRSAIKFFVHLKQLGKERSRMEDTKLDAHIAFCRDQVAKVGCPGAPSPPGGLCSCGWSFRSVGGQQEAGHTQYEGENERERERESKLLNVGHTQGGKSSLSESPDMGNSSLEPRILNHPAWTGCANLAAISLSVLRFQITLI